MFDKHKIGKSITDFEDKKVRRPISRVTLLLDNENQLTAGDDTGIEIIASCPYATQEMVNTLLRNMSGIQYHPFSATAAALDPAAELGDGVDVGNVYSVLASIENDGDLYPNISAPGDEELEEEYPAAGPLEQSFTRKIAETNSRITKTSEEISLQVQSINDELGQTLRVAADGVTITNAAGSTLTIDGGQIDASKIKTEDLDASKINVDELNLTGKISFSDLDGSTQNNINNTASLAQNANSAAISANTAVSGWTYAGTTYIDGSKIQTGTVRASTLEGGTIYLLSSDGNAAGIFYLTSASSTPGQKVQLNSSAIQLTADIGAIFLSTPSAWLQLSTDVACSGNLRPASDASYSLGASGYRWSNIYAATGSITTSDAKDKKDISYDLSDYDGLFDQLKPVSYKLISGTSDRRHIGLVAQDVQSSLDALGISTKDFAGIIINDDVYGLRYGEFIPLLIREIQALKSRVRELETQNAERN